MKIKITGYRIDLLLLDSVSTLGTMKDMNDKLHYNQYSDTDTKLLSLYSKALYLHILNNVDDIHKTM